MSPFVSLDLSKTNFNALKKTQ